MRRFLVLLVFSILLISCSKNKTNETVKVGYLPIYVDLPLFVAKERGFFEKRGVQVELTRFESSPEIGTSLLNGSIDAGASIATSVVLNIESRDQGKMKVFVVDAENKDNYLSSFVVLKDSKIKNLRDLKGKKIGSFPGPTAVTFGKMVLEKFGINPATDVEYVELATATHLSALGSKTVDALFTYEPTATQAVLEKNAIKLVPGAVENYIIDPWQAGVWVVNTSFKDKKPELTKKFIMAIYDAIDYMRANPDSSKKALTKYTSIKPEVAKFTPNIPFTKLGEVNLEALQKHSDILMERKVLSKYIDTKKLLLPSDYLK
ncbi:MAG: ABC transporter substrate-binding protein [Melioribacter sp.]|nr:ABC transporter substrate-binding protein [Melioribacter sp.]